MKRSISLVGAGLWASLSLVGCGGDDTKEGSDGGAGLAGQSGNAGQAGNTNQAGGSEDDNGGSNDAGAPEAAGRAGGGVSGNPPAAGGRSSGGNAGAVSTSGGRDSGGAAGSVVTTGGRAVGGTAGATPSEGGSDRAGSSGSGVSGSIEQAGALVGGGAGTAGSETSTGGTDPSQGGAPSTGGTAGDAPTGGVAQGGAAGNPGCVYGDWRPCSVNGALGDCASGIERCDTQGNYGECSIQPEASDSCTAGHDENCNGTPNEGCACDETQQQLQACGPRNATGICTRGVSTCTDGVWGPCEGAEYPRAVNCGSDEDADCDGSPDSESDSCSCAVGVTGVCGEHPEDGWGVCRAGVMTCIMAGDGSSSGFGDCEDSVGPSPELCNDDALDENCDGRVNDPEVCDHVACTMISAGFGHTCAVMSDGSGRCWGRNPVGQLGSRYAGEEGSTTPVSTSYMYSLDFIAAGNGATCYIAAGLGSVGCWGTDSYDIADGASQLPDEGETLGVYPAYEHACALTTTAAYCWGIGDNGRIGQGNLFFDRDEPTYVSGTNGAIALSVGEEHACVIMPDHTVQCWGSNSSGQCGTGSAEDTENYAAEVQDIDSAVVLEVGGFHSCAVLDDATVACWGNNSAGQIGDGSTDDQPVPVPVLGLEDVQSVCAGWGHSCALKTDGTVSCWGYGAALGYGGTEDRVNPVSVQDLSNVTAITCGTRHSCALLEDGTAWCWGSNDDGELGDGTTETDLTPVQVAFP